MHDTLWPCVKTNTGISQQVKVEIIISTSGCLNRCESNRNFDKIAIAVRAKIIHVLTLLVFFPAWAVCPECTVFTYLIQRTVSFISFYLISHTWNIRTAAKEYDIKKIHKKNHTQPCKLKVILSMSNSGVK